MLMFCVTSCEKETEGMTRITYYPELTLEGDATLYLDKGTEYVEPGYTAILNGEDVTDQVEVTTDLDMNTSGLYSVVYSIVNADGFTTTTSRSVYVYDMEDAVEGIYDVDPNSYRLYDGAQTAYSGNYTVFIANQGDGTYLIDDVLGGWYCQRAGYGTNYAMQAILTISDAGEVQLLESYIPGWGDSLVSFNDGLFDQTTATLSYHAEYVSELNFYVTMTKR